MLLMVSSNPVPVAPTGHEIGTGSGNGPKFGIAGSRLNPLSGFPAG